LEQPPIKVLIIRFSSIGDIVLTTPVVRCLKQQRGAEIHFITKQSFRGIAEANPHIDKVFAIQKKVSEVLPTLRAERYDYIVDLHNNLRSLQLKFFLSAKSYTFDKINWQKWLLVNWKINRLPNVHIVERYMQTVQPLDVHYDKAGLDYFIPSDQEVNVPTFFEKMQFVQSTTDQPIYIALVIGAAHATKRLPEEKLIELCRKIQQPTVLLGGPGEANQGELIAEAAGKHVLNTCGKLSLHQSASLVRQAWRVITHDTGLMHIAAAFQKPILSIWGNTVPEFGMYPLYPEGLRHNTTFEIKDLACRPCSKIGFDTCPRGHFRCMQQISTTRIAEAAQMH